MNRSRFLCVLLNFLLFFIALTPTARADSETEMLRKEVQELKKTVNQLSDVVRQQNRRLDQLSEQKVPSSHAPETNPPSAATEAKAAESAAAPQPKAGAEAVPTTAQPGAPASSGEIESLLNTVNNAPPVPGSQSRSIGLWKYPTGSSPAAKLLPDISVIGTFSGAYFSQEPSGDQGPNPSRTGFTFQELELGLQSVVDPYFKYDAFLSFSESGVEVEEAYFTTLSGPPKGLQFLGGIFRLPFGRQNPKHLHAWNFADDTLVNHDLLGPDGEREVGLEMAYLFPTPFFLQLQGTFTNGSGEPSFGGTRKQDFLYQGRLSGSVDINNELTLLIGASGAFGFNNTAPGNQTDLFGGDLYLKWKPSAYTSLSWQTEYILRRMQFTDGWQSDGGLYSYLDYQFFKRWHAGFRYDQMGIPSQVFPKEFRLTPALTFQPTEFSQIRAQYEYDKVAGESGNHAGILQFMFSLGVHGAHPF